MQIKKIIELRKIFNARYQKGKLLKFTTKTAFFSVFLGSFSLILALSILDGFEDNLIEMTSIATSDIFATNIHGENLPEFEKAREKLKKIANISQITGVLEHPIIMRVSNNVDGFMAKGIDINNSELLKKYRISLFDSSLSGIFISKDFAESHNINTSTTVILYKIDKSSSIGNLKTKIKKFDIVGTYDSGLSKFDKSFIIIDINLLRNFLELPSNTISKLEIKLKDFSNLESSFLEIEELIGYPYLFNTVKDYQREALVWIEVQKEPVPLVLSIIIIIASLNIIIMLLILIVEKSNHIAILKILGLKNFDVKLLFLSKSLLISMTAGLLGSFLAFILVYIQESYSIIKLDGNIYFLSSLPVSIYLYHYTIVLGSILLLTIIAVLIPASIATKINVLKSLRYG